MRTRTFDKEPGALRRALLPGAEGPLDRSIVHLAFRIARGAALALLALLSVVFVEDAFAATRDPDTYIAVYQLDATAPAWSSRGLARYVFDSFLLGCACLVAAWVVGRSLPESAASRRLVVASNVLSLGLFAILAAVLVYGRLGGFDH